MQINNVKSIFFFAMLSFAFPVFSQKFIPDRIEYWALAFDPDAKEDKCIVTDITNDIIYFYDLKDNKQYTQATKTIFAMYFTRGKTNYLINFKQGTNMVTVTNADSKVVLGEYSASQIYVYLPRMPAPEGFEYYKVDGINNIRKVANASNNPGAKYYPKRNIFMGWGGAMSSDNYLGWTIVAASRRMPYYFDVMYNRKGTVDGQIETKNNFYIFKYGTGFRLTNFASLVGNVSFYIGSQEQQIGNAAKTKTKHSDWAYGGGLLLNIGKKKKPVSAGLGLGLMREYNPVVKNWQTCLKLYVTMF